jgi:hypothetical protein
VNQRQVEVSRQSESQYKLIAEMTDEQLIQVWGEVSQELLKRNRIIVSTAVSEKAVTGSLPTTSTASVDKGDADGKK